MKPYGREKKIKGGMWKVDYHPKRGYVNWWENMCDFLSRSRMKQMWEKEVNSELGDNLKEEKCHIKFDGMPCSFNGYKGENCQKCGKPEYMHLL